jgi:hypothetical protein
MVEPPLSNLDGAIEFDPIAARRVRAKQTLADGFDA